MSSTKDDAHIGIQSPNETFIFGHNINDLTQGESPLDLTETIKASIFPIYSQIREIKNTSQSSVVVEADPEAADAIWRAADEVQAALDKILQG